MLCWSVPIVLFLLVIQSIGSNTKDHSIISTIVVPDETGCDVVDAVVNIITRNCIFPDDQFFLRRLAMVESTDGSDIKFQTSEKYHGGIWKLDKDRFQQTKSLWPVLRPAHELIRKNLNINWDQVGWSDLRKPLYSGLAAALYILLNTGKRGIPSGISEQALLWKSIYQPKAPTSIFLEKISKLKLGSSLLGKHNQTFLCGKHNRSISNIEADSKHKTVHIGDTKDSWKPSKTLSLHVNTILGRVEVNEHGQNQLLNKSYQEGILNNLCTKRAVKEQRKFAHPSDRKKFIICSAFSKYSIRNCYDGKYFSDSQQVCTQSNCEIPNWVNQKETTPLDKSYPNPCTIDTDRECNYVYVSHKYDPTKFIQCDKMGLATLKTCPIDWIWDDQTEKCFYRPEKLTTLKRCIIPIWDNPDEIGTELPDFYSNPCTIDSARVCDYVYIQYMLDNHKFIRCDKLGKALLKTCPTSSNWDTKLNKCETVDIITTPTPVVTTPKPNCSNPVWDNPDEIGTELPDFYSNPCTIDSARVCDYVYIQYMLDNHKFIRCDKLGKALLKTCPTSSNWDTKLNKCETVDIITTPTPVVTTPKPNCSNPVWDNPDEIGTELPDFYSNPCTIDSARVCDYVYIQYILDNHKFIRCDKLGKALLKTCPTSSNWDTKLNKCETVDIITTPTPVVTTPKPNCSNPVWDNPDEIGTELPDFYSNPCTIDSARVCDYVYIQYILDNHKFIRCDKLGKALLKTCPTSSNWDTKLNKCETVDIITTPTPVVTTPKLNCSNPVWDNPDEIGTELPDFYSNPCTIDSARVCDYVYIQYILDNHKFIRCDKLGKALLKTCPTSSNWDTKLNKCETVDIITTPTPVVTTPKPNCSNPVWDNPDEIGTELPDFYSNPCTIDSTRVCDYVYIQYILDNHKFIRCDKLGKALLKTCPTSSNWDTKLNKCETVDIITTPTPVVTTPKPNCSNPVWDNPNEIGTALPDFYSNPCTIDSARVCDYVYIQYMLDNHKFIRCDKLGKALLKTCPTSSNWDTKLNKCETVDIITTPTPVVTTPKPNCPNPVWDNPNEVGTALPDFYPNPCTIDSARACDNIYVIYIIDHHKFIMCNKLGQALIKTCPTSLNWNTALNKCATVATTRTSIPVITTPKPTCSIPVWDNPNEIGTALPDFYPNPCTIDLARACNYKYINYILDDNKFIRCDKLGQALLKSCPTSSNWDTALDKCATVAISKVPLPKS